MSNSTAITKKLWLAWLNLSQAIEIAEKSVNDAATRTQAKQKFVQARVIAEQVQVALTQSKSDWVEIGRQSEQGESLARQASTLVQVDKKAVNAARASISQATSSINRADRFYGHGVLADLNSANRFLREAENWLQNQAYESAKEAADQAHNAAVSAESTALVQVSAIKAEIFSQQQQEERRREEEHLASIISSYNNNDGDYGGGYSGGGGYGGGDSGGGSY